MYLNLDFLNNLFNNRFTNDFYSPVSLDDLPYPDWADYTKVSRNDFLV